MTPPRARIVFMGTPEFAVVSLDRLVQDGFHVAGVVTGPDKPQGRGRELRPTAVKDAALRHHLPLLQPDSLKDPSFHAAVAAWSPDVIVVVAFRILPPALYRLAPRGAFNLHASLLPRYRGAAPINWAIMRGDTETGVTTFFLEEHVDTGAMILQRRLPIGPEDDAGLVHDRLAVLGADAVAETVRCIEAGTVPSTRQDPSLATAAPKIFKDDCRIRWGDPVEQVHNFIRGLAPFPSAWTMHGDRLVKIHRAAFHDSHGGEPGSVTVEGDLLLVQCGGGRLRIQELQLEGKKRMEASAFLRGYALRTGAQF